MFARCTELFVQALITAETVGWPAAMFSDRGFEYPCASIRSTNERPSLLVWLT